MATITVKVQHADNVTVNAQVRSRVGVEEVDDAVAVALASYYQASGKVGHVLAALASGATVEYEALQDDIRRTRAELGAQSLQAVKNGIQLELDMLGTWALDRTHSDTVDYINTR